MAKWAARHLQLIILIFRGRPAVSPMEDIPGRKLELTVKEGPREVLLGADSNSMKGFTFFELLIAIMLTAVIGTVMFKTWDTAVKSGEKAATQAVEGRERDRIVFGIMDNDMAAIQHPDAENSSLPPRISKEPILPDEGFL